MMVHPNTALILTRARQKELLKESALRRQLSGGEQHRKDALAAIIDWFRRLWVTS
jgi:hypothetical protein